MRNIYDDFIQQKPKEMSKTMSDMAFKYINPETQQPTKIPAVHFEKELGQVVEREITQSVNRQFLSIIYSQLNSIKKDNEKLFYEALICIDNNLNPKDLRIPEQIAIGYTYDYIQEKQRVEKKEFRFFNQDITDEFNKTISDPNIQAEAMELSNHFENQETRELNRIREEDSTPPQNNYKQNQDIYSYEQEDEYERDY